MLARRQNDSGPQSWAPEHRIVLVSLAEGSDAAVGAALSQAFNIPADFGRQIARSAPIVIVGGLRPDQARAVLDAMAAVRAAGGKLAVSAAQGETIGRVNWPGPPKICGRGLETFR